MIVRWHGRLGTLVPPLSLLNVPGLAKMSNAFRYKLLRIADEAKLVPDYLATVISFESGFKPDAKNPLSKATGLIQWLPSSLKKYGYTPDEFQKLSALQQLDFVKKHYQGVAPGGLIGKSVGDHYMAVFMPYYIGHPTSEIVGRQGSSEKSAGGLGPTEGAVYDQNKGFDKNADGIITVGEIHALVTALAQNAAGKPRIPVTPEGQSSAGPGISPIWILLGLALAGAFYLRGGARA